MRLSTNLKKQPWHLLLLAAIFIFISGWFWNGEKDTLDIIEHDTYFIIGISYVFWLFAILIAVCWLFYLAAGPHLPYKSLTWIHISVTIACVLVFLYYPFLVDIPAPVRKKQYRYLDTVEDKKFINLYRTYGIYIIILLAEILLFVLAQILLLAHLLLAVFHVRKQRHHHDS